MTLVVAQCLQRQALVVLQRAVLLETLCELDTMLAGLGPDDRVALDPVRAGLVAAPEQAAWSSVHGNLGLRRDPLLTPHPTLLMLGGTPAQRRVGYRSFLRDHRRACAGARKCAQARKPGL